MIPVASLRRYLGREVHVYGRTFSDDGDLQALASGRLEAIESSDEGCCLAIGDETVKDGPAELVDLAIVGSVVLATQAETRRLQPLEGGKVHRLGEDRPA